MNKVKNVGTSKDVLNAAKDNDVRGTKMELQQLSQYSTQHV